MIILLLNGEGVLLNRRDILFLSSERWCNGGVENLNGDGVAIDREDNDVIIGDVVGVNNDGEGDLEDEEGNDVSMTSSIRVGGNLSIHLSSALMSVM